MDRLVKAITRRKTFAAEDAKLATNLKRCLGPFSLASIAIGQMLGVGIYVLAGSVVRNQAGPAVIFSLLIAGFAALLSAFSYAELGGRFPRAGSAYTFAYVALGELLAFVVGWTMTLEYLIALATIARALSGYFNALLNDQIRVSTMSLLGLNATEASDHQHHFFSSYPDVLACAIILVMAVIVSCGPKSSTSINNVMVILNLVVIGLVIANGLFYLDIRNWTGTDEEGRSMFLPYGYGGILAGAATCFYSFVGFEAIGTAGEEAKKPRRTIPLAIFGSFGLTTTAYVLMAVSLTLMIPFNKVSPSAPFSEAFAAKDAQVARVLVTIGAVLGMLNNALSTSFSLPRSVYALADDGLIFTCFARVSKKTKVPYIANAVFAVLSIIVTAVFDVEALVEFVSIGTLCAYTIVSICVLVLRYSPKHGRKSEVGDRSRPLLNVIPEKHVENGNLLYGTLFGLVVVLFSAATIFRLGFHENGLGMAILVICGIGILAVFLVLASHRENQIEDGYQVPLVPFIPLVSLTVNVFLMVNLSPMTWIRLVIWMAVGLSIYFGYGVRHSKEAVTMQVAPVKNTRL